MGKIGDPLTGFRSRLHTARLRWQPDRGAIAIRENAIAAVEVAGLEIDSWLQEQLGLTKGSDGQRSP